MAAQIQVLRRRSKSAQSIKKITRALELIATSRIGKARARAEGSKPYTEAMTRLLTELASDSAMDHPLLVERENPQRAAILVVTSGRGQCGGYNHKALKTAAELQALLRAQGKEPVLYVIGRKGVNYYRFHHHRVAASWTGISEQPSYADAAQAARTLVAVFMTGHDGEVADTLFRALLPTYINGRGTNARPGPPAPPPRPRSCPSVCARAPTMRRRSFARHPRCLDVPAGRGCHATRVHAYVTLTPVEMAPG